MPIAPHSLPDDMGALKSLLAEQTARNEQLTEENQRYQAQVLTLTEQLNLALARRYAASSEKLSPDQICLFDEAEVDSASATATDIDVDAGDEDIVVAAHKRKKRGRRPIPAHLPRIDVVHELPVSMRRCDHDGVLGFFPRKRTNTARSLAPLGFPEGGTFLVEKQFTGFWEP